MSEQFRRGEDQAAWVKAWIEDRDEIAFELLENSVRTPILMAIANVRRQAKVLDLEMLWQEARVCLVKCAARFRPEDGVPFGAYYKESVRRHLEAATLGADTQLSMKKSNKERDIHRRVRGIVGAVTKDGRSVELGITIAAWMLCIERDHAAEALSCYQGFSLSAPVSEDEGGEFGAIQMEARDPHAVDQVDQSRLPAIIEEIIEEACKGDDRARHIVRERHWGEANDRRELRSFQSIADEMGMTRERARQIHAAAIVRMASALKARGLGLDDLVG